MTVRYLDLTDYLAIAAEVTGVDPDVITHITNLDFADSALHAPSAAWASEDFYPDFRDKAAVLVVRLVKNQPVRAENPVRPAQATIRYSKMMPPSRSVRRSLVMSTSLMVGGVTSDAAGGRWLIDRRGRCAL